MTQVPAGKPERPRPLRDEREATPGLVFLWEQGRLFANLCAGEGGGEGFGSSLHARQASADTAMVEAFAEQLVPRLNAASQWPLQAVFYLPRLGRIDVNVRREMGALQIELDPEEERTRSWLGDMRQRCEDRLSAELRRPVQVSVTLSGCL